MCILSDEASGILCNSFHISKNTAAAKIAAAVFFDGDYLMPAHISSGLRCSQRALFSKAIYNAGG